MLVTIIVGLLASISAPFIQAARDKSYVTAAKADLRTLQHAIQSYVTMENQWPTSIAELVDSGYFTSSEDISVCYFLPIPAFSWRDASVLVLLAHSGSATMVYTVYPIYNGQIIEFQSNTQGCAF